MKRKSVVVGLGVGACLLASSVALAAFPTRPNLIAAYFNVSDAIEHLNAARTAKSDPEEFGGHRAKAEQLLREAMGEIKLADDFADAHSPK